MDRDTLRGALKELGRIPFHSTFDRVFLYRCVAQQVSPRPERFSQADLMDREVREAIYDQLAGFLDKHLDEAPDKQVDKWRNGVLQRLDIEQTRRE
jgi:hypothetical protein